MLIVMSWFISAICEETVRGLDGRVVTTLERESSMRWDWGLKPVKIEGEFMLKLEVSSTVKRQLCLTYNSLLVAPVSSNWSK